MKEEENKKKFKVGDKVRLKESFSVQNKNLYEKTKSGVTVTEINNTTKSVFNFRFEGGDITTWYNETTFEIIPVEQWQSLTHDERKDFVRAVTVQLFSNSEAYKEYKNLYQKLKV